MPLAARSYVRVPGMYFRRPGESPEREWVRRAFAVSARLLAQLTRRDQEELVNWVICEGSDGRVA